jgi:hypothetical protein
MNQQTLSICIIITSSLAILINIFILIKMKKLMTKFQQLSYNLFRLKDDMNENHLNVTESLETLQSSVANTLEDMRRQSQEKIYPMPQLSNMITETIAEQIQIHSKLNSNRRVVPKEEFEKLITAVCMTYPNVSEEYITEKAVSIIESMKSE